jgi:hypothetical protein
MVAVSTAEIANEIEFMNFIAKHSKNYSSVEEYNFRLDRYLEIDSFIKKNNDPSSRETHTAAHNQFSDWTEEEFKKLNALKVGEIEENIPKHQVTSEPSGAVDWRNSGCNNPPKN